MIGLRDIVEEVDGFEPKKCSVSFDVSGDQYDPVKTDVKPINNQGININKIETIELDIPNN